jgi:DNA-3-methyladenine glycosylase II
MGTRRAITHLKKCDPILASLIERVGPCKINSRKQKSPYTSLARAIVGQQLSVKAASSIFSRVCDKFAKNGELDEQKLAKARIEKLRSLGLSRRKAEYIRSLAKMTVSGALDFNVVDSLEDEEAIKYLYLFKGIGRWTAEMFLIFQLERPDVLAVADVGLQRAMKILYDLPETPDPDTMLTIAEPWRPYRSIASWYLWRSLEMQEKG